MQKHFTRINTAHTIKRLYFNTAGLNSFANVDSIPGPFTECIVKSFRHAFVTEKPLLIKCPEQQMAQKSFPAAQKWFKSSISQNESATKQSSGQHVVLNHEYLGQFRETILPYEYIAPKDADQDASVIPAELLQLTQETTIGSATFHRFHAPLQLFLTASSNPAIKQLYIAQAQLIDLPPLLRADLPTPLIVNEAGKGDIYDSNIWLGIPPTYTTMHRDPNPNLFVQLAGRKVIRMFRPQVGREIFTRVKKQLGQSAREGMRGVEMMQGEEMELLNEAVWGNEDTDSIEVIVGSMDALFIPKGWWHSIKSIGTDVNCSVNWWFR